MLCTKLVYVISLWYPSMKIRNAPQETCQIPIIRVLVPTLPGTQIYAHSHYFGHCQSHYNLPLRLLCPIIYERPLQIPL